MTTKPEEISPYSSSPDEKKNMDRQDVRNVMLSELNNFRGNIRTFWGSVGRSLVGNIYGFFLKRGIGFQWEYRTVQRLTLTVTTAFPVGATVTGATSGATGTVTARTTSAATSGVVLSVTGAVGKFTVGEAVSGAPSGAGTVEAYHPEQPDYARIFVDGGNDASSTTPSWVFDFPDSDKLKFQSNDLHAILRLYGRTGHEVYNESNVFLLGAIDCFAPIRPYEFTVGGLAANDPEDAGNACYSYDGFNYIRNNGGTRTFRMYLNGGWKTVTVS